MKTTSNQINSADDSDTTDTLGDVDELERERIETQFEMLNDIYPIEDRPPRLRKKKVVGRYSLDELMKYQKQIIEKEKKENLGEEVFAKDAGNPKTKYKKMSDDGRKRLHTARWNRLPIVPPHKYYGKTPKKRTAVIRNFPMEHYGITGQISETTIGMLHNRSVKVALDSFCKATYKPARGGEKAGKYADLFQLMEAIVNYAILLQALWPYANPPNTAHAHNSSRGRGGTFVRGRGSFRGAQRGGHRPSFVIPQASNIILATKSRFREP